MGAEWLPDTPARGDAALVTLADAGAAPEDVLVSWLLWMPDDADLQGAAAEEVARLDAHAPLAPGLERLRALLSEIAEGQATQ